MMGELSVLKKKKKGKELTQTYSIYMVANLYG